MRLLEPAYGLPEFIPKFMKNPKYVHYQLLYATGNEWTIVKYDKEVLSPFQYWTL